MDVTAYLGRIGWSGSLDPSPELLRELHIAHLQHVPFENLDIHRGCSITLDQARCFEKIVRRRRGGFCYELNSLFGELLRTVGFEVDFVSARVARIDGSFGPEFDHLALIVRAGGERWLADVGFGDSFTVPLRLAAGEVQDDPTGSYRISKREELFLLQREKPPAAWVAQYRFSLLPRRIDEFGEMSLYHQTSPDSSFTRGPLCTIATPEGRVTLTGTSLTIERHGVRSTTPIDDERSWLRAAEEYFGIEPAAAASARGTGERLRGLSRPQ